MTNLKISSKKHLLIVISALIIVIGMAVGTVFHFVADGFFNFGSEFSDYTSITVSYPFSDDSEGDKVAEIAVNNLSSVGAYTLSESDSTLGGELEYKFAGNTDTSKLNAAVDAINAELAKGGYVNTVAVAHTATTSIGGTRVLNYAAIALSAAVAFQIIYFAIRYKLGMAVTVLLSHIHNLALFVALVALTRLPVGIELVAACAVVVVLTMIMTSIFFDDARKNIKDENLAKEAGYVKVDMAAGKSFAINLALTIAVAVVAVVLGVFATIASLSIAQLAPFAVIILGAIASFYGSCLFTPAVYSIFNKLIDERLKKGKASKAVQKA
jgi:preprotein translocase subunit SecF